MIQEWTYQSKKSEQKRSGKKKKKEKKMFFFFLKESVGTKLQNPRQELILKRKRKPKNSCFALPFVQQK